MIDAILRFGADVAAARIGNRVAFAEVDGRRQHGHGDGAASSKGAEEIYALAREISQRLLARLAA